MLHNEARELLVKGYEKSHDAAGIAQAYSVSIRTVYRLVKQKREAELSADFSLYGLSFSLNATFSRSR